MWLSGLHVPESYITALVQIACHDNFWPLDKSTIFTVVTGFPDYTKVFDKPSSVCTTVKNEYT